tara:strand:+ start:641 stop:940 length:300 start_codon:yes stop_codon:yes gene_type:complete
MQRPCFTLLIAVFLAAIFTRSVAAQLPQYCFPDIASAKQQVEKYGERLRFTVVMKIGALAHIYASQTTMTILVEQPSGVVCTGPALLGDILKNVEAPCA